MFLDYAGFSNEARQAIQKSIEVVVEHTPTPLWQQILLGATVAVVGAFAAKAASYYFKSRKHRKKIGK